MPEPECSDACSARDGRCARSCFACDPDCTVACNFPDRSLCGWVSAGGRDADWTVHFGQDSDGHHSTFMHLDAVAGDLRTEATLQAVPLIAVLPPGKTCWAVRFAFRIKTMSSSFYFTLRACSSGMLTCSKPAEEIFRVHGAQDSEDWQAWRSSGWLSLRSFSNPMLSLSAGLSPQKQTDLSISDIEIQAGTCDAQGNVAVDDEQTGAGTLDDGSESTENGDQCESL